MSRNYHKYINCFECDETIEIETVIENCLVSWPNQKWVYFKCPKCSHCTHLKVSKGHITTGEIDGAPGPCFYGKNTYNVKGFIPKVSMKGIKLTYGNVSKHVRAK